MIGIYKIQNKLNNKIYIGSAKNIKARWFQHKNQLERNVHHNAHLQRAWNKYGNSIFEFILVEKCALDKLLNREQYYIDTLHPYYNMCLIAGNTMGVHVSDETKEKIRKALKGRTHSLEARKKMSLAQKGKKHKPFSPDVIKKMSETRKGRPSPLKGRKLGSRPKHIAEKTAAIGRKTLIAYNLSRKGKHLSKETKEKISRALIGRKVS